MKNNFGEILRDLRAEKSLTQDELGKAFNVANNTISSWERGNSFPDLNELIMIAKFFEVSTDYLLGLED